MIRRGFLTTAAATSASAAFVPVALSTNVTPALAATPGAIVTSTPITGIAVAQLAAFDSVMVKTLEKYGIPGGQCAVAKDGRLVYARGFGYVDVVSASHRPPEVSPTARFRIASSTKPFTAVAILKLVELRRLRLDERAFDILNDLTPPAGTHVDPRLRAITVRHLLEHSAGFVYPDANGFDPQFDALRLAAAAFDHPVPATHTDIIRYAMGRPLGFSPGTRYVYSNLGYNILGRIVERRANMSYGSAVQSLLLDRIGVHRMALMTRTSPEARLSDEVFYYDGPDSVTSYAIYNDDLVVRPYSYGGFDGRAIDAHGGGIASAPDLTRFLNAVAGSAGVQLLKPSMVAEMLERPNIPGRLTGAYYGLGWDVMPGVTTMSHAGAITFGTLSFIFRLPGEITCAALFNHLDPNVSVMGVELGKALVAAAYSVQTWPSGDLYSTV